MVVSSVSSLPDCTLQLKTITIFNHSTSSTRRLNLFCIFISLVVAGDALWVGDVLNFRLQRLHAGSGRPLGVFGQLGDAGGEMPRIKGVAVDTTGYIWVSDAHLDQVALYNDDGDFLMNLGGRGESPGEFAFPAGIAAHPDGRVAVADSLNRRIQIFSLVNQQEIDDE
jgi:sugar lactone lactonase YvrE